jgi:hypothetical protein
MDFDGNPFHFPLGFKELICACADEVWRAMALAAQSAGICGAPRIFDRAIELRWH